ncbi:hypothetical protein AAC387_Pa01g1768 [Persea americana]
MLCRRRPHAMTEDLEALAFGDQALGAPQPPGDAPSSPLASAAPTSAPTSPTAVVVNISVPVISPSVRDRGCPVDISKEEGWPEKRPRIEASPSSLAEPSSSEVAPQSPWPTIWRPDLEADVGRPLNVEDCVASNPYVVVALGRACALPWDIEKWGRLDNATLLVSTMRSAISVVQKCQVGLGRLGDADSKIAKLEAEKEGLQAALDVKDEQLREEARKNAGLVADLEKASAEVERLDGEVERQSRLAVDLVTAMNQERAAFQSALEEKKAELESAMKAGVSEDDLAFRYPPKVQSSDPVSSSVPCPSSVPDPSFEALPGVDAATEAVTLQADPEACPEVEVAQTEINCNAEAAAF